MRTRDVLPALGVLGLAFLLGGCGGGSTNATTAAAVPSSPAASTAAASSTGTVASVAGVPISKSGYEHWVAIERAGGATSDAGHRALGFLITSQWVLGEATARKLSVSEAAVKQRFSQVSKQSFPKAGALQKFLAKADETEADLLARIKVELLRSRIVALLTAGKPTGRHAAVLASFEKAFQAHWKRYTTCKRGYVMEDCSEYAGKPEDLTAPSAPAAARTSASGAARTSKSSAAASSSTSNSSGELPAPTGGQMSISSPAFERNGEIPKQYTCDGANTSPPLEWRNVPAKAAALVLFVIDESATGPASGIRWVVGDIDPTSKGVAAGQTPAGAIAGADTQGHAGYGGICPAPGKTSTVEFVLYALSKKIPLTPGFTPAVAESEYGSGKLLMGSAAVTYGVYRGA